jgi:putative transcriptional regulator
MGLVVNRPQELNLATSSSSCAGRTPPAAARGADLPGRPGADRPRLRAAPDRCSFQATVALEGLSLTTSQDVLFAIADGVGPGRA